MVTPQTDKRGGDGRCLSLIHHDLAAPICVFHNHSHVGGTIGIGRVGQAALPGSGRKFRPEHDSGCVLSISPVVLVAVSDIGAHRRTQSPASGMLSRFAVDHDARQPDWIQPLTTGAGFIFQHLLVFE